MASRRASGLPARLDEVERERLPEDRLPDEAERDEPERDEPDRDVEREELDRDALEEDREPELWRVPEPDREDVLRELELPPLALVLRERVEREDDEPELLEPDEPPEPEAPRLGCGIKLSPCSWGLLPRHPTDFCAQRAQACGHAIGGADEPRAIIPGRSGYSL